MRRIYVVPMRWMVIYEYEVTGGTLNISSPTLPKPWSPWESSPSNIWIQNTIVISSLSSGTSRLYFDFFHSQILLVEKDQIYKFNGYFLGWDVKIVLDTWDQFFSQYLCWDLNPFHLWTETGAVLESLLSVLSAGRRTNSRNKEQSLGLHVLLKC
jgi:hypothetical protein